MLLERVLRYGEVALSLGLSIYRAVREGRAERVSRILPDDLLTTLERKRAEIDALARYGRGDAPSD